ncbi:transposase [Bifidobacterium anseris]|uniref:Transposase n=1 Tax=Bifidobacterium anseris TaxID=2020963 RepID=A0A2N5J1A8_9BIFI|nr:IS607 family element RNA-guided endonuclease TnpB [Bifidobacterium anseris]PLS27973.1 transposase [Bifidobacterium anseris]
MLKGIDVALDPTPTQERLMRQHAGAARFAYNAALAHIKACLDRHEKTGWSYYGLRRWWNGNKDVLAPWWKENSKEAYNTGLEALSNGLTNWWKSKTGQRKGRRVGFPKFKKRTKAKRRFTYTTGVFGIIEGDPYGLKLPRIGRVHCMENMLLRTKGGKVTRMTVSYHGNRWHAALTVDVSETVAPRRKPEGSVGVDLGIKTLATMSDGTVECNERFLRKAQDMLRHEHRALSRKQYGSNRYRKQQSRLGRVENHVANQRRDRLDKLTTRLANTYADIHIEDLNVQGMMGNHKLAKDIADAAFGTIRTMLTYKTAQTGSRLHIIDHWYPSSKTCSNCGAVKATLSLNERTYHCEHCGYTIDRDLNAAINIKNHVAPSAEETVNARGGNVRRDSPRVAVRNPVKREPSSSDRCVGLGVSAGNGGMLTKTN